MNQIKKNTGKGHTLFEMDCIKSQYDVWILVAESCYEISRTLLAENTYATELYFSLSGYDGASKRGAFFIKPEGFLRYPIEIYKEIHADIRAHKLINELLSEIRRIQVRVVCKPYVIPLFDESEKIQEQFQLLEKIRKKLKTPDIVGNGFEGIRYQRISTYTPKRSREIQRAFDLLAHKPKLLRLLAKLTKENYWHRIY
jgi:hypothetical protein